MVVRLWWVSGCSTPGLAGKLGYLRGGLRVPRVLEGVGGCWACSKKTPTLTSVRCVGAAVALKSSWVSFVVRSGAEGRETSRWKMYIARFSWRQESACA